MDNKIYEKMWALFQSLGSEALALSHYDLAAETKYGTPPQWKEFLTTREVSDWIKSEQTLIQTAELNKLIHGISKSHSVGQAQIMNTLAKLNEQKTVKDGPVFVYTYIPLSPEQNQADNVVKLNKDPFLP
jgi:D-Tyr-tRNAtyr deacylase